MTNHEYNPMNTRFWLRRLRNLVATAILVGVFLQAFGAPRVSVVDKHPRLRLVPLERPVWTLACDAVELLWAKLFEENTA